ncbi:MAG: hypothetical protein AAGA03_02055 [Planctomycetota bacterium]
MSNSPFEIFRRNLKPLMVVLTGLALFSFVVLPALDSYLRRSGGAAQMADPVVATFDGKEIRQSREINFTRNHLSTLRFLSELAQQTIDRGGAPRVPGFQYNAQTKQIQAVGITPQPGPTTTVQVLQMAGEAKKAGLELDDTAIGVWLNNFTDGILSESEVIALLMQSTQNTMGRYHLYDQLRSHLLADAYQRGALSGLVDGRMPIQTPSELWESFKKLNQSARVSAYGVLVSEYVDQTDADPGLAKIQEVYEDGKERFPSDQSPDPGFRRPYVAEFEYVAANLNSFTERVAVGFSEEELREEYERRLSGGDFVLPEETTEDTTLDDPLAPTSEGDSGAGDDAAEAEPDAAEEMTETEVTAESGQDAEQAGDPEAGDSPEPEASPEPETPGKPETSPEPESSSEPDTATVGESSQSSRVSTFQATRLVAYQDVTTDDETADAAAPSAEDAQAPATEATDSSEPEDARESEGGSAADQESKTPMADVAQKESDDSSAESDEADAPKTEPFENVREQIADDLAQPTARKQLDEAVTKVYREMQSYFRKLALHESRVATGTANASSAPERPDLKAIAEEIGLEYGTIGPRNVLEIQEESIAASFGLGSSLQQRGPQYRLLMYGDARQGIPPQAVMSPLRTVDINAAKTYISWKTSEKDSYVPALEEIQDEVVEAARLIEARELAKAAAEAIAEKVNAGTPLADAVPESKDANYKDNTEPFTWLNSLGFMGQVTIGNVQSLDSVGEDFMAGVFATAKGTAAVAPNGPKSVYYVFQPTAFTPEPDELRRQFAQPTGRMNATMLGSQTAGELARGFMTAVNERTGLDVVEREP